MGSRTDEVMLGMGLRPGSDGGGMGLGPESDGGGMGLRPDSDGMGMGLRPNSDARYGLAAIPSFHAFALTPFGPLGSGVGTHWHPSIQYLSPLSNFTVPVWSHAASICGPVQ
jgi:hypothetical protein